MRKCFDMIQNRRASRGEPRHGFKKGICKRRDCISDHIRKTTEKGEDDPYHRYHEITVFFGQYPIFDFYQFRQQETGTHGDQGGIKKSRCIVFTIN